MRADAEVLGWLVVGARAELPYKKGGDVVQRLDPHRVDPSARVMACLLYTNDGADDTSPVVLGGRRLR